MIATETITDSVEGFLRFMVQSVGHFRPTKPEGFDYYSIEHEVLENGRPMLPSTTFSRPYPGTVTTD